MKHATTPAEIQELWNRSDEALAAARKMLDYPDFAAARAYYAVFYAASAELHARGFVANKHRGTLTLFAREFVKTGLVAPEIGRLLQALCDLRTVGDYGV